MTENNGKTWKTYKWDINDEKHINESLNLSTIFVDVYLQLEFYTFDRDIVHLRC